MLSEVQLNNSMLYFYLYLMPKKGFSLLFWRNPLHMGTNAADAHVGDEESLRHHECA